MVEIFLRHSGPILSLLTSLHQKAESDLNILNCLIIFYLNKNAFK